MSELNCKMLEITKFNDFISFLSICNKYEYLVPNGNEKLFGFGSRLWRYYKNYVSLFKTKKIERQTFILETFEKNIVKIYDERNKLKKVFGKKKTRSELMNEAKGLHKIYIKNLIKLWRLSDIDNVSEKIERKRSSSEEYIVEKENE